MNFKGGIELSYEYNLSSERWRKPEVKGLGRTVIHYHSLEISVSCYLVPCFAHDSEKNCVFCQADLTYDRTLEEILYHFYKHPSSQMTAYNTLIDKWKNNRDAWDNPIGKNIKG